MKKPSQVRCNYEWSKAPVLWFLVANCDTPFQYMRISESVADHLSLFLSSGCSYVNVAQLIATSHANYNNIVIIS